MAHDYLKTNLATETQHVEHDTGMVGIQIMATLVGGVLLICAAIAWLIFPHTEGMDGHTSNFYATILAMISAILLGAPLVWVALKDLLRGHMHMNELVALAVLAAFAGQKYMEAASIAFFMILSVLIESRTALGARASIESLIRLTPTKARKLSSDGQSETEVATAQLITGDIVRVRPGDNIPADGLIVRGNSTVNQANITGESLPVDKQEGDEVFGGTSNVTGVMDIQVTKAGHDTTLGRVKDLIMQAERTRIPIMRMIDQYAAWYSPTVLMLAFIVWWFTRESGGMDRAIAMLVVACPCALILATPTAMVAGLSAAARLGVLIKSVVDLEAARNLTAMIFDKTGTLTTGELQVARLSPAAGIEPAELLRAAASVEHNSRHPVARAVSEVAKKARLMLPQPTSFEEISGRGVRGLVEGSRIVVGRANWIASLTDMNLSQTTIQSMSQAQSSPEAEGLSLLFVVREGQLLGWIGLADNTRPQAATAMDQLRELGMKRLIIVTGDRESVAKRVAAQMHTEYKAEVLPQQKLEMVDLLKAKGHRVAVIGDGVNDAPALAAGDISIAMGAAGSDVAIHSASIALMNNNLNRIPFLIELSRKTSWVIRQNLAIGIGFILVFMLLAAAGYITPIVAAIFHLVSGLVVIFNSARLVRSGEDIEHREAEELAKSTRPATTPAPATATPALA